MPRMICRLVSLLALAGAASAQSPPPIDGSLADWPAGVTLASDADEVRLRFAIPHQMSLQSAPVTIALCLDMDGDPSTGRTLGPAEGVDLRVLFSPPYQGRVGNGLSVTVETEDGPIDVAPSAVDLVFLPTHASDAFELRLGRVADLPWDGERVAFHEAGTVRWWIGPMTLSGEMTETWDAGSGRVESGGMDPLSEATLPGKADGAVRLASFNVLWASPMISPAPFVRMMNAVDADIWLFQEWDIRERDQPRIPVDAIEEWLETHLSDDWTVFAGDERGVLVASRLPLTPTGPGGVKASAPGDRRAMIERSVRYTSAVAETPAGRILLGCVHLKCCGGKGGDEDRARIAEAIAVNTAMHEALERSEADAVVLGGDFNLVGSEIPMPILTNGLDPAGFDLAEAGPMVLGADLRYTWTESGNRFPAARLDFVLYSSSSLETAGAWILDTARLGDAALSSMGLERGDSAASDHRPIIVDFVRAN